MVRQAEKQSHQIQLIEKLLSDVLPDYEILNPYEDYIKIELSEAQQPYLPLIMQLVKRLTLLYRHNRIELKKNYYESTKEDITATLGLLQGKLSPLSLLSEGSFYSYLKLKENNLSFFTRKQAIQITGYKPTQMHRVLNDLYQGGLLERTGHKNKGYYYKLIQ